MSLPVSSGSNKAGGGPITPPRITESLMDKYYEFMKKRGMPVTNVPNVAKHAINLQAFLGVVTARGGMEEVRGSYSLQLKTSAHPR